MNGDISVEASRPRPLSGGIWTLFSWLRRDERSFSDESLSSVGSDRTAVSFAFLEPLHYKAAIEPIVLPPLSPPTDSYKKRVRDRNFRRQRERDITLHRKYGLFKDENSDRYDVLSLPPARRNILNSGDKAERGRRATSESFQRRAPYVPGKRRAPLPPAVTTSLPRNLSRKRPAPPPPTKLTDIHKQSIELCAESMNTKPGCDKPSCSSKSVSIDAKIEKNNREEKIKSDKSFLKQIFENRKRNSATETNYVKLLPNISELDKQAAKIIENKKLKVLEGNANVSMSRTDSTSPDTVKEKWICTLCLRKYNAAVSSCLYCVKNEKQTHESFKNNVNISSNVPTNIYTQTDNELLNVASTSKAGLSEEKKKLKEMLKEMKDSLPKRPKHSIIDTESPTLRIGSASNHEDKSTLHLESPSKADNNFIKSLDKLKVQNIEESVSVVALKGCIATNKNGSNSRSSSRDISTNYPVKKITPQLESKNTGQKEFETPETSTEIINKNICFNDQSNVSSKILNIPLSNFKTTNQCNTKQNETDSLLQPKDSFSEFEFIKKGKINNTQLEFQPDLSKSKNSPKIKKESQSSIITKNTKPLEVMHSVINKAALNSDLSNIQMRRTNTQENNIQSQFLQTKIVHKSSICNKPKVNVERRTKENNMQQSAPSKVIEESDKIGKSTDKMKATISSLIDAPSIHTPLKISSLLNPFYLPAQTNCVNTETSINISKTKKSNVSPSTSSDILQQSSIVSISKSPKSIKETSETNENENTAKEIKSPSNIITNDQYSTNTSVCKVLGVIPSSSSKEINNNNVGKIDHHFRRRELVNQLEQSIAKGDEQSAADAAIKLAKLRLSCSVLSFSSQIVGNDPTTSKIDMPILKPKENETNKKIKFDLDEKLTKQNVESKSIMQNNLQLKCKITKSSNKNNEHVTKESTTMIDDQENKTQTNRDITSLNNVPCEPSTSKCNPVANGTTSIQIWVEDKEATRGPINLRIPRQAVMGELRLQAEKSLGLDSRLQRWIIGRTLCLDDTIPLVSLAGPEFSAPFYLCLVESETNKENANGELAKEHKQDKVNNIIDNTREVYTELMKLEQQAIVANTESFECSVCMEECEAGKGAVLRECIHTFCRDCLSDAVRHCEEPIVSCPAIGCPGILQEREIRALLPTEDYERWLARGLATAECGTRNAFHCRTRDCTGWALCEPGVRKFPCPVCKCNNCVPCQAIHEAETCEQYQNKLRTAVTAAQTNETDEGTQALLNSLIRRGEALECPECHAIITKKWGCDWVKCSACKTEICWVTRGRRWGPGGRGDTSAGCRCGVDGKKCHPSCGYCH
ncbi:unnamed protein product [Parnassius mnemosyne]|uniref:RanBP-type and C3HC4-type zinc finger-containing protein 1 n=1 Tax=Parnassius mnemosyne TaxID=213953 RepID=A0AAV1M9B3_9NEOP